MLAALIGRMAAGLARGATGAAATAEKAAGAGEGAMMRYGKQLTTEQLSHLKQKGFEPAKNSLGASFIKSETGKYAKESDIDKELEELDRSQAKSVDAEKISQEGAAGGGVLAVLKSIDSHLASILETLRGDKQKEAALEEETATEQGGAAEGSFDMGALKDKLTSKVPKNPWVIIAGLVGATLVPLMKTLKSAYTEYLEPVFNKLSEVFNEYIKPFFMETLPKFFMEDIPEFFTKTLPDLFFDGVTLLKSKIEKLEGFFSGLVGKMKEALGEIIVSIGESKAVTFFLGKDNFLTKKGKELKEAGQQQQKEADKNTLKLSVPVSKDVSKVTDVKIGSTVEYKGQKFTVPQTQAELDNIKRRIDQGDRVDSKGNVIAAPEQGEEAKGSAVAAPEQGGEQVGTPPAAAALTPSTPSASTETGGEASGAAVSGEGTGAGLIPSTSSASMESAGGSTGAEVASATMAATEPEPVPGTPGYDKLRKKLSGKAQSPANTSDNTTIPEVFPILGSLGNLLYFNSDANANPLLAGGAIG